MEKGFHRRMLYGSLTPAVRICARLGVSITELREIAEIAYYREVKRRGHRLRELQSLMDVSSSTAMRISKRLTEFFSEPHTRHGVHRRILNTCWAEPLTLNKLSAALPDVDENILESAVMEMVEDGRLEALEGRTTRYELTAAIYRFTENEALARFEALNSFLIAVSQAIEARFFDDEPNALVRTNRLRVRDEDVDELRRFYEETVHPFLAQLDGRVTAETGSRPIRFSILWAPDPEAEEV